MTKTVQKGDKIKVHYTGTLDDGQKFDSSEGKDPLEFKAGEGMVIKGFDEAVIGMKKEEEKDIHIKSDEAYGKRNAQLVQKIPKEKVGDKIKPEKGQVLAFQDPQGRVIRALVVDIDDQNLTIDLNHPLAGKDLNFKVKIVDIA